MSNENQYKEEILIEELIKSQNSIFLYNDDINTFDYVIELLCKYCSHDLVQAEQCAWIVHYNGKCIIKRGSYEKLKPICDALIEGGLKAEIH